MRTKLGPTERAEAAHLCERIAAEDDGDPEQVIYDLIGARDQERTAREQAESHVVRLADALTTVLCECECPVREPGMHRRYCEDARAALDAAAKEKR